MHSLQPNCDWHLPTCLWMLKKMDPTHHSNKLCLSFTNAPKPRMGPSTTSGKRKMPLPTHRLLAALLCATTWPIPPPSMLPTLFTAQPAKSSMMPKLLLQLRLKCTKTARMPSNSNRIFLHMKRISVIPPNRLLPSLKSVVLTSLLWSQS